MNWKDNKKLYDQKYAKNNLKRIPLDLQRDYYENVLLPAVQSQNETVNGFIKLSIQERIDRLDNRE